MTRNEPEASGGNGGSGSTSRTRAALLDAAEELMATRGIHGPSLNEINTLAGQRNKAALQYHFGGRDGLLRAVLARHLDELSARSARRYAAVRAEGSEQDLHALLEVMLLPLVEHLEYGGSSAARFVRIWAVALSDPELPVEDLQTFVGDPASQVGRELVALLSLRLPREVAIARTVAALSSAVHLLADRAVAEESPTSRRRPLPLRLAAANLVDMLTGALAAPASPQTCALLGTMDEEVVQ